MGQLPFSKELLPLQISSAIGPAADRPVKAAIDFALEVMSSSGLDETCVVIGPDKRDIPAHTGNGERYGLHIEYTVAEESPNVPVSLDKAWFLTRNKEVALLFPDIVFEPRCALENIIGERRKRGADLTLALVPAKSGEKIDIVTTTQNGVVKKVTPKPGQDYSGWTWVAAAWNASFTTFLHNTILSIDTTSPGPGNRELYIADVINASLDAGYRVSSITFPEGKSYDLGTYEELNDYWQSGL